MIESRRRAYLEAMGYEVWLARPAAAEPDRIVVGPGEAAILLLADSTEASATRFAGDVARALGAEPVWGWPQLEDGADGQTLSEAIGSRLFTRVVLFGPELARRLFGGPPPEVIGSARISVAPDLEELTVRGSAKQALWHLLSSGTGGV